MIKKTAPCSNRNTSNSGSKSELLKNSSLRAPRRNLSMGSEFDYRSKSTAFDRRDMQQIQPYSGPPVRSYSTNTSSYPTKDFNLEMTKGTSGSTSAKNWGFNDPEFQRMKRVAGYKVYGAEGRVKGSFKHSFRWFKDKYTKVVYGWW